MKIEETKIEMKIEDGIWKEYITKVPRKRKSVTQNVGKVWIYLHDD